MSRGCSFALLLGVVAFLLIPFSTARTDVPVFPPWDWDWESPIHTLTWGTSMDGMDSEEVLDILITRDIVYVQGFNFGQELQTNDFTNALREMEALRKHKLAKGSTTPHAILGYRGIVVGPQSLWNRSEYEGFWLHDDAGNLHRGVWDFRNVSARRYYIDDLLSQTNYTNADGIFIDTGDAVAMGTANLTVQSRRDIFNATALLWRELVQAAQPPQYRRNSQVFIVTPSLKGHFGSDPDGDDGKPPCTETMPMEILCSPYNEDAIYSIMGQVQWGPHRQFNIPSRDFGKDSAGCVVAVRSIIEQGRRGPQFVTCNGCNHSSVAGQEMFRASFATFLMGSEPYSYFGAGTHFHTTDDWNYQWPDLQRPVGEPLGPASQSGLIFVRHFRHLSAKMDCETQQGTIVWH